MNKSLILSLKQTSQTKANTYLEVNGLSIRATIHPAPTAMTSSLLLARMFPEKGQVTSLS